MVATIGHDLHRFRRGLLNDFFPKRSVLEFSCILHEKKSKLVGRFEKSHQDNTVLKLDDVCAALTAGLISQNSWGISSEFLEVEQFNNNIRQALNEISMFVHINRFFPVLGSALRAMHRWL